MSSNSVIVCFKSHKIFIKKLTSLDCLNTKSRRDWMSLESYKSYVVNYCLKDHLNLSMFFTIMYKGKGCSFDETIHFLYKECLKINPDLKFKEKEKDMGDFCEDERKEKMKKFWMVVCYEYTYSSNEPCSFSGKGPRERHETKKSAEKEAKAQSKIDTSRHFVVLEAMESFTVPPQNPERTTLGDWTDDG